MNPLKALFGRGDVGPRKRVRDLLGAEVGPDVLVVDGATPPAGETERSETAAATRLVLGAEPAGLPFLEDDGRRLPTREGGWRGIVLLDVVDRVLEPAFALRTAAQALAPGGRMVLLQHVAPDDLAARGAWNALARLRDARHTWTPTRRQVRAMAGDAGFALDEEALWEDDIVVEGGGRPETAALAALYVGALHDLRLVESGRLAARRLALVLGPR